MCSNRPTIGPMSVQQSNGVVDIAVADEAEAVAVAKQYLSYFQGRVAEWSCADQRELRGAIPEDRKRGYDVRTVIDALFDTGTVLGAAALRSVSEWSPRWRASRVVRSASSPTTPATSPGRSTATAPTRRPGSCSCAMRSTSRSSRSSTRRG